MEIGKTIKLVRNYKGMSQQELATRTGITSSYLSLLESGQRTNLSISNLGSIADELQVPISLLVFMASDESECTGMDKDLFNDLSEAVLSLIGDTPEIMEF